MPARSAAAVLVTAGLWLAFGAGQTAAMEPIRLRSLEVVWRVGETPLLARLPEEPSGPALDYGVYGQELAAFLLKEVFPDADDEYAGSARLPSRLSEEMPDQRNEFGEHSLIVAHRLWVVLSEVVPWPRWGPPKEAAFDRAVPVALAGGLAARELWKSLRNEIVDRREGVSLRPKISRRKLALSLTFRW